MASSSPLPSGDQTFQSFVENWLAEQSQHLQSLISASQTSRNSPSGAGTDQDQTAAVVDRAVAHYEQYYSVKSTWVQRDPLSMLNPTWMSSLENALLWIGGWRPSTAFHLLYSKSWMQTEGRLMEVIRGITAGDLGDITPDQIVQLDSLKQLTIKQEKEISEMMAQCQETIADPLMVELSHEKSELIMKGGGSESGELEERLKALLGEKEDALKDMMAMADQLRLKTLKGIMQILKKKEAMHFLIAAAELHLRVHEWGREMDSGHL